MKRKQEIALTPQVFLDRTVEEYAFCDAKVKEINAEMDKELFSIRQKYADVLTSYMETKENAHNLLQSYALQNPQIFPAAKKSLAVKFGSLGFRTGKPKLRLLDGFTWDQVTEYLDDQLPSYLRVTIDPAKDKLLADRHLEGLAEHFPVMGLEVVQDETFFIDLKKIN